MKQKPELSKEEYERILIEAFEKKGRLDEQVMKDFTNYAKITSDFINQHDSKELSKELVCELNPTSLKQTRLKVKQFAKMPLSDSQK